MSFQPFFITCYLNWIVVNHGRTLAVNRCTVSVVWNFLKYAQIQWHCCIRTQTADFSKLFHSQYKIMPTQALPLPILTLPEFRWQQLYNSVANMGGGCYLTRWEIQRGDRWESERVRGGTVRRREGERVEDRGQVAQRALDIESSEFWSTCKDSALLGQSLVYAKNM